jgi:hypothetical protein
MVGSIDANAAGRRVAKARKRRDGTGDLVHPWSNSVEQFPPGIGGRDTPCGAFEQPHAQPLLHQADRMAQSRLGNAERGGCACEAPFPCHSEECSQVASVDSVIHEHLS